MSSLPTPLESAVAATCTLLTALEALERCDDAPRVAAALVTRLDELLDELTDELPLVVDDELEAQVDELRAARETGEGLADAAEQQAAGFTGSRAECACGLLELAHDDELVPELVTGIVHGNPVCVRDRALA